MDEDIVAGPFKNPISKAWTFELLLGAVVFIFLGFYLYTTSRFMDTKIFGAVSSITVSFVLIVVYLDTEVIVKPSWVTIRKDGTVLKYRTGKERFVPWSDWDAITRADTDVTTTRGRYDRNGRGKLKGRIAAFDLTYDIAEAMQKAYVGDLRYQRVGPWIILATKDFSRRSTKR